MATKTENDDEKKVMDVAKPGESKPDTGSKPMVVGHKFLTNDPDVKTDSETSDKEKDDDNSSEEVKPNKKIVLAPISDDVKPEDTESEAVSDATEKATTEEKTEPVKESKTEDDKEEKEESGPEPASSAEDEQINIETEKAEQEERLNEIIKTKKYNVPIKAQNTAAIKSFLITFLLVTALGIIGLALLIDAELLDLGIDIPFDFL